MVEVIDEPRIGNAVPSGTQTETARAALETPSRRHATECPVEDWLGFLGHRWTALILWHLQAASMRHKALMACLPGITAKMLSERLGGLARRGLVRRTRGDGPDPAVAYELTPKARRLMPLLDRIELWSRADAA